MQKIIFNYVALFSVYMVQLMVCFSASVQILSTDGSKNKSIAAVVQSTM